jgi:hypothetical protein
MVNDHCLEPVSACGSLTKAFGREGIAAQLNFTKETIAAATRIMNGVGNRFFARAGFAASRPSNRDCYLSLVAARRPAGDEG